MSVSVSRQGPFFNTGPISWSDLREEFRAANIDGTFDTDNDPISVSDLYRSTDKTITDPIVPDCEENRESGPSNNGVPTSGSFAISRMRDTIKYYLVTQSGTDTNVDFDSLTNINYQVNLNRNIRKRIRVNGTITAQSVNNPAAQFNAQASNIRIEIGGDGRVLGFHGVGGTGSPKKSGKVLGQQGQAGGPAFELNSANGNNNVIFLNSQSNVWGGGGGGRGGKDGSGTTQQLQQYQGNQQQVTDVFGNPACEPDGGKKSCEQTKPPGSQGTPGCAGIYDLAQNGCACSLCQASVKITFKTAGGDGAAGRGVGNLTASLIGEDGEDGDAESGGDGGDWGQAGNGSDNELGTGGAGGAAMSGSGNNFTITGAINSTTIKGLTF